MCRAFSSSLYKDTTFSAEIQIELTYRNTLSNVKRRVLHKRGSRMYYITRSEVCVTSDLVLVASLLGC